MATAHGLIEITQNSQSTSGNYSNVTAKFYAVLDSGYVYSGYATYPKLTLDGTTETKTLSSYNLSSSNPKVLLGSITKNVSHNADGSKTVSASFSWDPDNSYLSTVTGSASKTLTKIPRYATSVQSLKSKTETTITMNWSSDSTIDYVWYSTDWGTNWVAVGSVNATSGSYTINKDAHTGGSITANTTYNVITRVRRKDSQLTTNSSKLSVTTHQYPYCTSAPNFTIGNAVTLGFHNPLGRSIAWQVLGVDGSVIAGSSTTGTSYKGINGSGSIDNLYKSIPSAQSGTYKVKVTYGSNVSTITGGTYSIKGTEKPTIGTITYADTNTTVTDITGNNQHIVQNKSNLKVTFTEATAKNSATISKHSFVLNGVTKTTSDTSGTVDFGTVNSANNLSMTVMVTDSRGLTTSTTKTITMLPYSIPTALVTLQRLNNYEDETYLTVDGSVASVNSKNTMAIKYRYKLLGGSYNDFVTIGDKVKQTLSLDKNNNYIFNVVVTDAFGSTYNKEHPLGKGVFPLFIDTEKNSIGVNMLPSREQAIEVKGIGYAVNNGSEDAMWRAINTTTGKMVGVGVGSSGINRGVYDYGFNKWLLYADEDIVYVNGIPFEDSGWITVTFEGSFAHYNNAQILKYRKIGKQVFIRGAMKPTAELDKSASTKAFTLPDGYRPAQLQDFLCQGSTANKWLCEITTAGVVSVARYGTTEFINIPTTAWLPVHISFLVD